MKGISTRLLLAATLLLLVPPIANAKCGERFFVLSGSVVDAAGAPAVGVPVGVAWTEEQAAPGPVLALTDDSGRYAIAVRFNTYSGMSLLGDRCNTDSWQVSIAAYGATHRSEHRLLDVTGATRVAVPTLRLDAEILRDPLWPDEAGK